MTRRPRTVLLPAAVLLALVGSLGPVVLHPAPAGAFGFPEVDLWPSADDCLAREHVEVLSGAQDRFPEHDPLPDDTAIDARRARWHEDGYPVNIRRIRDQERRDLCFVGGSISNPMPHDTTPWAAWHDTAGMVVKAEGVEVHGTDLHNVGDGIRFNGNAPGWTVRGVRMSQVHDDCIENDGMQSGQIIESFFDGCYVFYSARGDPYGDGPRHNDNVVTVRDSVVHLAPMPSIYDGRPGPGHGPLWKMSGQPGMGRAPQLEVFDTVIRIDEAPAHGSLAIPAYDHDDDPATAAEPYLTGDDCARNTIVWLGEGPFPASLPACFEVTTDLEVWNRAVAEWEAAATVDRVGDLLDGVASDRAAN